MSTIDSMTDTSSSRLWNLMCRKVTNGLTGSSWMRRRTE
ncbi:Uncharacterised protein [Mycobacteroides abscessus subsp. abscessus]|nr:Uncharacterised protein [Mycobacteroides abscessus subsp. abscessus]SKW93275.1 Uncharacterised protein [Mycobacteroides abscessus subsp. abscessus]